ncbi:sigma 54-interacting transcriptional regulator [Desulfococcaceae bacterium HSG7]|nr:sigma 54-interacting transcriptional regulator [Desulfococcaceae bacterium HSG7]
MPKKTTKLKAIQEDVQRVAEAISSSLGLEAEIVDEELTVIAGTGEYKEIVGLKEERGDLQAGYIYGRVVTLGKAEIVEDAQSDPRYDLSVHNGTTKELAEVCYPIIAQGEVLGVIGLVAFSEDQRRFLLNRKDQLLDFAHRMAELLASKAIETEILQNMIIVSNQLRTIIESVDDGILAVDNRGIVMHCNRIGSGLIQKNKREIIGKRISRIWPGSPIIDVLKSGQGYDWREESYQVANHNMDFMVTAKPVISGNHIMGVVATFRDVDDVRKKAYEMVVTVRKVGIKGIWGESPQIQKLRKTVKHIAQTNATVLITGETGTGKGLAASAIHHSGPRLTDPFISVNCSAIPDTLLESELFGYAGGAFSGAKRGGKPGKFELAAGGTLYLDEIGDMPLRLQPKLLHALQTKQVERLGGLQPISVDARVIASTNRNLEEMMSENEFRKDLFFRLNIIPIHISPLRDRKEDILILLDRFLEKYCRNEGKAIKIVAPDVKELFLSYNWPGNARELENTVEYMACMETGETIEMNRVPARIKKKCLEKTAPEMSLDAMMKKYEKDLLRQKLADIGTSPGDKEKLAEMLNISRATLYRKLKKFDLL